MKNFEIEINRTFTTRVVIQADSIESAETMYKNMILRGDIAVFLSEQGDETLSEHFIREKVCTPWKDSSAVEGQKYARKCDITGEGMNEGWVIDGGSEYIKYEEDAIAYCKGEWGQTLKQAYSESEENGGDLFYWTDWNDDESDWQYVYLNGILTEIE